MEVKVVNKSNHRLPEYATSGSAGLDLKANIDEPIKLCSFINDDYRVDASLKSHILEVKIQSTKYKFVGTEGDVPFMQAFNISELMLMDKCIPNSLIDLYRMSLDVLEKTISEFSLHDSTHIKYIYTPNKLY